MRNCFSQHSESLQARASDVWPYNRQAPFRPWLNIQALHELLQITSSNDMPDIETSTGKGKKRASKPPSRAHKRVRTDTGAFTPASESTTPSSIKSCDVDWPRVNYPELGYPSWTSPQSPEGQLVPVLQHIYEIQYSNCPEADRSADWKVEEDHLVDIMKDLQRPEPRTIDLGDVDFVEYHHRLVVVSPMLRNRVPWCLLLPLIDDDIDLAWYDLSSELVRDPMMAAYILKSAGRAVIQARLKIVVLPADLSPPFQLHVETSVSLCVPQIYAPFPRSDRKMQSSDVEDAQRRLLEYLYPSKAVTPVSFDGSTNISFFYSVLQPAPPLSSVHIQEALQPVRLVPKLLPFQRRSVSWLLAREGKIVTPAGDVVPITTTEEFSFWDRIEEGNMLWYLNRLSGMLADSPPELDVPALGGILAEEPGLGKTLESIALILMNPSPPERNPSVTRWDPVAKLDVKAIKSTLIVTPPALASQWVDELATHAPSLKVMAYDGWSKVPVPITASQVEAAKLELLKKKKNSARNGGKMSNTKRRVTKQSAALLDDFDMDIDDDGASTSGSGSGSVSPETKEIQDWFAYVNSFDVVITTYNVLRSDFNVALAAPVRPRREDVVYSTVERTRSPLVMVEWNRVIMDEVQMVGGGKVEDMVSLIPRLSSFAVSGTPARQHVPDLIHVLKFLRVDNIVGSTKLWSRLVSTGFGAAHFAALFQAYGIRTLKTNVKAELTIPQQTRYLVNIRLGPVEKHVYDQTLETALQDLGLDARGVAASEGWQIDGTALRSALRRLRGICTHPQVGQLQRPGDKLFKPGAVKTIDDVLQNMQESNWRTMMDDHKAKVQAMIRIAQLQTQDENDRDRFRHALDTLTDAEREASALLDEAQAALDKYNAKKRQSTKNPSTGDISDKVKGKQREISEEPEDLSDEEDDEDSEEDEDIDSPQGEKGKKRGALQHRLRECRIALHRAKFLQGDVCHALGPDHSAAEDAAYGAAEKIRRELLKGTEDDATRAMALLTSDASRKNLSKDPLIIQESLLDDSKLTSLLQGYTPTKAEMKAKPKPHKVTMFERVSASADLIDEANSIIDTVLNKQSDLLWEWRSHMTSLLTEKLASSEDQPDGDEYQRTLDNQGEAETYLQSYTALLADRRQALLNERTLLAAHDVREKKLRHTKAAIRAANALKEVLQISEEIEVQPEHEVLHLTLSKKRKNLLDLLNGRAIKSVLVALNNAATRITKDSDPEKIILKEAIVVLRGLIAEQGSLMDKLEADLILIRKAFNHRILYFRQLQEISDTVAEVVWDGTVIEALLQTTLEKNELDAEINKSRARQRYLANLTKNKQDGIEDEDEESCILCRCEFVRGFITQCAHVFCEGCMKAWLLRKEGKTCPVCRVAIDPDTIQRFTNTPDKPDDEKHAQRTINGEPAPKSRRQITYNMIDAKLFDEIKSMESFGDFGSKIQTLICHLLYIENTDPGAKSIVFSAWADSLLIMERALKANGIRCLRIDQKSKGESAAKRFKSDPEIIVLLLHGERENAGLNVTCASRVFLLESVVHHGFEIQAIARIDRMGQTRPTEVYCYYAEETVERNILDLAARQGLSLYTKDNYAGTLNVSSFSSDAEAKVVDSPKKKKVQKGDFILKMDDMLAILFPHMYEELEYLIPEDAEMESPTASQSLPLKITREQPPNAVAGPSRTRSM